MAISCVEGSPERLSCELAALTLPAFPLSALANICLYSVISDAANSHGSELVVVVGGCAGGAGAAAVAAGIKPAEVDGGGIEGAALAAASSAAGTTAGISRPARAVLIMCMAILCSPILSVPLLFRSAAAHTLSRMSPEREKPAHRSFAQAPERVSGESLIW